MKKICYKQADTLYIYLNVYILQLFSQQYCTDTYIYTHTQYLQFKVYSYINEEAKHLNKCKPQRLVFSAASISRD